MATSKSVKEQMQSLPVGTSEPVRALFEAILTDMAALRTSITGITAKLDADTGVADTNYASTQNPAALTLAD